MAPRKPATPKEPPASAICGILTAGAKAMCNLPLGHEGEHQRVSPMPDTVSPTTAKIIEASETVLEAAERVFGEDALGARPVIAKLAQIMGELPVLAPEGTNKFHNYKFIKDTQVSGAVRPRMARLGLIVIPDVVEESWVETKTKAGGISWVTKLKINFTVVDSVSGDSISGHGFGYGDDSGDKGANKAFTAALKYWLMKLFQIGGEDDLENDEKTDQRSDQRMGSGGGAAETGVTVTGGEITGIARGGMSDKITNTQAKQIGALYKDLDLTPEAFVLRIDQYLGDKLALSDDESQHQGELNAFIKAMSGEDAGSLISKMVEEKDAKATAVADKSDEGPPLDDTPYDQGTPGGG